MASLDTTHQDRSRKVALGLLLGVIVLAIVPAGAFVWSMHRYYDSNLAAESDKLDRYRRIAASRPEVVKNLEAMRAHEPRKFFLRSGAAALSAAEAQEAVRAIVEAHGGRLITMQAPNTRDDGRYRQVTVNVQLTANVPALRKILHDIETRTPFLFIDNLMVRSQVRADFKPGPNSDPEMFVNFDVSGYAFTGPA